jgi:hypothetical protein
MFEYNLFLSREKGDEIREGRGSEGGYEGMTTAMVKGRVGRVR